MQNNHISTTSTGWQTKLLSGNLFESYISEASEDDFTLKAVQLGNENLDNEIMLNLADSVTACRSVQVCQSVQACIESGNEKEIIGGFKRKSLFNNQSKRLWPVVVR